jgi:hypothetical protein
MTKFDELQQAHQDLLDRADEVTDKAAFAGEVQAYVVRVCEEAVDVPHPRDRDQLRANLRYWASYIYDATGTYPSTTMRPARILPESPAPPSPVPNRPVWLIWAALAVIAVVAVAVLMSSLQPMTAFPASAEVTLEPLAAATATARALISPPLNETPQPGAPTSMPSPTDASAEAGIQIEVTPLATQIPALPSPFEPLEIAPRLLTRGPSPFEPTVWVAKIRLDATGGNGEYVFWIDSERYPLDEFTVEGRGCQAVTIEIGVTSEGQSDLGAISIEPPPDLCR